MSVQQSWSVWISPLADKLSSKLIIQFEIQSGYGLSLFLDVNKVFDNHLALRVWVQRMLDEGIGELFDPLDTLAQLLRDCIPSN